MEHALNDIRNMEYQDENGNRLLWDHDSYPILEYGKRGKFELGT